MSDDKPTTPPEETPTPEEKAPETPAADSTEKKPLTDEEKAAKIAAEQGDDEGHPGQVATDVMPPQPVSG